MNFEKQDSASQAELEQKIKTLEGHIAVHQDTLKRDGATPEEMAQIPEAVERWLKARNVLLHAENEYNNAIADVARKVKKFSDYNFSENKVAEYQVEIPDIPTGGDAMQYGMKMERKKRLEEELRTGQKVESTELPDELL